MLRPPISNIHSGHCQGKRLVDIRRSGKPNNWHMNKQISEILTQAFIDLEWERYAERSGDCLNWLEFLECLKNSKHRKRLSRGNFCRLRICPSCQTRKAYKEFDTMKRVAMRTLELHPTMKFLFLTLTVPNIPLEKLRDELTHITASWHKLIRRRGVSPVIKGFHRAIEITYNYERNDYHPHLHIILAVNSRYFKSDEYIKHERWQEMWMESTGYTEDRIGSKLQVNIKRLKADKNGSEIDVGGIAEACKYSLKAWNFKVSGDSKEAKRERRKNQKLLDKVREKKAKVTYGMKGHIFIRDTPEGTAKVVEGLSEALYGKKLIHYAGIFKEVKKALRLKSGEETEDLIHITDETEGHHCEDCGSTMVEKIYHWMSLVGDYVG